MNAWHNQSITEAASLLATDMEQGLSVNEAKKRLARYGQNKLRKGKRFSGLVMIVSQFKSLVICVLIGKDVILQLSRPSIKQIKIPIKYILFSELQQHCDALCKFGDSHQIMKKIAKTVCGIR